MFHVEQRSRRGNLSELRGVFHVEHPVTQLRSWGTFHVEHLKTIRNLRPS
jgi:hypothetical protein